MTQRVVHQHFAIISPLNVHRLKQRFFCRIACDHVTEDPDVQREFQEGEDQKRIKPEQVRSLGGSLTF